MTPEVMFILVMTAIGASIPFIVLSSFSRGKKPYQKQKPKMSEAKIPKEVELGRRVWIRITKVKEGKRVTVRRLKRPKDVFGFWLRNRMRIFSPAFYVMDLRGLNKENEITYDEAVSEPIDPAHTEDVFPNYIACPQLEKALIDSGMIQWIEVASILNQIFQFTKSHAILLAISFGMVLPFGLTLNELFHILPSTIVHWLPELPRFGK